MKVVKRRLFALALILTFAFPFVQMTLGASEELNNEIEKEALSVITDVIGLDMTKYNVGRYNYSSRSYNGLFRESVDYTLETDGSKTQVLLTFHDGILVQWCVNPLEGSPLYAKPLASNSIDVIRDTLRRYQAYANATVVQEARNVLDTITELKPINATVDNLKMQVIETEVFTDIDWMRIINGLEFPTGLGIRLTNGTIDIFTDRSRFAKIGSSEVNVSREEAVRLALEKAKTITTVTVWVGDHNEVFPFRVKEEPLIVRLQVGTANRTMYPYWYVWFVADPEVYSTTGVEVCMRADTGEVAYCKTTRYYGVVTDPDASPDAAVSPSASLDTEPSAQNPPLAACVVAGAAATAAAAAVAVVAAKKRRR